MTLAATPARAEWVSRTEVWLHTDVTVTIPASKAASLAFDAVFAVMAEVERLANEWKPESPIGALNRSAGGDAVVLPPSVFALLDASRDLAVKTGGAFDPTWAALWGLYDFDAGRFPDHATLAARVALVGHEDLELDRAHSSARLRRRGMAVGLGGIAKGWALDRARDQLYALGLNDFLLVAGGQVTASGSKAGAPWKAGLRAPRGSPDDLFAVLPLPVGQRSSSLSTSGDYERFFIKDGVRYHHILDPTTGRPARGLQSASVVAPSGTDADALSTAVMVLGKDAGLRLIESLPGVGAVLVDAAGTVHVSKRLATHVQVLDTVR
ncbi:MAG: FAD:protein FMN transferase [Myxococcales bacterium]|nr:FAD:protein FMN transferase [Myxococcales bacterium]